MTIIDAHHHFWNPDDGDYGWLSGPYAPLRRVFTPDDLRPELQAGGVSASVLVQTWSSEAETVRFLELAETTDYIAGVVGWVDLTAPDVAQRIATLRAGRGGRFLKGIRHQVHNEEDENWLLRDDVRRGLAAVEAAGLVYDLLLRPRELPAALKTVQDFPRLKFVIDHIAKPDIKAKAFAPWAERMRPFAAERGHVWCKLSGMVTEADWEHWTAADLQPYVDEVLAIFGADRCLYGSDWPVCRVAGGYARVLGALKTCIAGLPETDRAAILAGSARTLYDL
ncbi:amidohydrolase family protein [Oryzibacter oryziterrae]|uniref:amidohydrolase family protein n=1 Tax=Oryzibacter oryziterrae TaxID=2766474 RepID=UPI001F3CCACF|nr:amidohydrolase family protein [Oryzibacter oryziterrae]